MLLLVIAHSPTFPLVASRPCRLKSISQRKGVKSKKRCLSVYPFIICARGAGGKITQATEEDAHEPNPPMMTESLFWTSYTGCVTLNVRNLSPFGDLEVRFLENEFFFTSSSSIA